MNQKTSLGIITEKADEEDDFLIRSLSEKRRLTSNDATKSNKSFGDLIEEVKLINSSDDPHHSCPGSAI